MPEIILPDPPADAPADGLAYFPRIWSVMLFPGEKVQKERLAWLSTAMAFGYVTWLEGGYSGESLRDYHAWIPGLWECKEAPRVVFEKAFLRSKRGQLVGDIFRVLLACAAHHSRHCTIERARALVAMLSEDSVTVGGDPVAASESLLMKAWPQFKPSAHLWAAHLHNLGAKNPLGLKTDDEWLALLGLAEAFRKQAEKLRIVESGLLWTAPKKSRIPAFTISTKPLREFELAWLDKEFPN